MKPSIFYARFIVLGSILCFGIGGNLGTVSAQTKKSRSAPTGSSSTILANRRLIADAEKHYKDLLNRYVTKCTDGKYYVFQIGAIYQFTNYTVQFKVSAPEFLSPEQKKSGLQLEGEAAIASLGAVKKFPEGHKMSRQLYREVPYWTEEMTTSYVSLPSVRFRVINGAYTEDQNLKKSYLIPTCEQIQYFSENLITPDAYHLIFKPIRDDDLQKTFTQCGNRFYHAFDSATLIEVENVRTAIDPPERHYKAPYLTEWKGTFMYAGDRYRVWERPGRLAHTGTFSGNQFLSFSYEIGAGRSNIINEAFLGSSDYQQKTGPWHWEFPNARTQHLYAMGAGIAPTCDLAERFIRGENVQLPTR